ncbi:hypothetical protein RBB78_04910 [Tunturiibacter empetritectus]|uniref:hypothetical protein n=1 Tax=Tunturiibacter empetritectus TaxID=3069691 RepID=UPI003D9B6354
MRRLARGHGRKGVGPARGANLFDGRLGRVLELPVAVCFETFRVEEDEVVLFGFKPKNLGGEMLDGVEEFAVAGKKKGSIGAGKLDADYRGRVGGRSAG